MRERAKAIGGYYPTPERIARLIAAHLVATRGSGELRLFDPCCGTGSALRTLSLTLPSPVVTVGVELQSGRAQEAHELLSRVLQADAYKLRCTHHAFSVLFVNPPYDDDAAGSRQEETFLKHTLPYVAPGGVVIAILPIARLAHSRVCRLLTTWCTDFHVVRFPTPEYEVFTQAVVFGVKMARGARNAAAAGALAAQILAAPSLSQRPARTYRVPRLTTPWELTSLEIDPHAACALVRAHSPLWHTPEAHDYFTDTQQQECHPLLPPRKAHVATLAAAGLLNNAVLDGPEGPLVLKGSIRKHFRVDAERSSDEKLVEREQLEITIKVIDRAGVITTLQ
jgi:predicted RNA methylase